MPRAVVSPLPFARAKPAREPRYLVPMPRKSGVKNERRSDDSVSLRNSLREGFS